MTSAHFYLFRGSQQSKSCAPARAVLRRCDTKHFSYYTAKDSDTAARCDRCV
jgi:hypothetical protein